jgi:hypothetical protein
MGVVGLRCGSEGAIPAVALAEREHEFSHLENNPAALELLAVGQVLLSSAAEQELCWSRSVKTLPGRRLEVQLCTFAGRSGTHE